MYRNAMAGVALMIASLSANSATLQYDEKLSGDIYSYSEYIGALDIGLNTITGHAGATFSYPSTNVSDMDDARVQLMENQQITNVSLSIFNIQDNGAHTAFSVSAMAYSVYPIIDKAEFYMDSASLTDYKRNDPYEDHVVSGTNWEGSIFDNSLPIATAGFYDFAVNSFTGAPLNIWFDYTWTVKVASSSPVPIPASFWLFATALIGLISVARIQSQCNRSF